MLKKNLVAVAFKDYFLIIGKQAIFHPGFPPQCRGNLLHEIVAYHALKLSFEGCNS